MGKFIPHAFSGTGSLGPARADGTAALRGAALASVIGPGRGATIVIAAWCRRAQDHRPAEAGVVAQSTAVPHPPMTLYAEPMVTPFGRNGGSRERPTTFDNRLVLERQSRCDDPSIGRWAIPSLP